LVLHACDLERKHVTIHKWDACVYERLPSVAAAQRNILAQTAPMPAASETKVFLSLDCSRQGHVLCPYHRRVDRLACPGDKAVLLAKNG
jgi:uncharacterized Zn-finger protein